MNFNWPIIGDKIFGILKGSGYTLQMFDKTGTKTMDPHDTTRFYATIKSKNPDLDSFSILVALHDENADSHLDIKTPNLEDDRDFNMIHDLKMSIQKNLGEKEGLKINWYKFDHAIRPKDEAINNIQESKDIGKVYGHSLKSSYQRVGESKLIIRHTDPIDESKQGSRWRKIREIFIETKRGERFAYPHMHVTGARAMARHLSNDGEVHDEIGQAIRDRSADYMHLKRADRMLRGAGHADSAAQTRDAMRNINSNMKKISGPRGYKNASQYLEPPAAASQTDIDGMTKRFLTDCQCQAEDPAADSLKTAARYIILIPKTSEHTGIPEWLPEVLRKLAVKMTDQEAIDRLHSIANDAEQGTADPAQIRTAITLARTANGSNPEQMEINRLLELGGVAESK
jgi:hypothetical protein